MAHRRVASYLPSGNIAVRLLLLSALLTTFLASLKLYAGYYGYSHALIADGIHSIADIFVDFLVALAAHYGSQQADHNHPYGHGRIETAAVFGLALILLLASLGIIIDGVKHIWVHSNVPISPPHHYVLWVALIAVILNEGIFRISIFFAKKTHSHLLEANAWHSRSDAAVSLVVLLGVAGAIAGWSYLDSVGAIFVGGMLGKMGVSLAWKSMVELVDTGVEGELLQEIRKTIASVEGVKALHLLRSRTINHQIFIDVHVLVSSHISVSEGHYIGDQVIFALRKKQKIFDVTVHVDPEDDEKLPAVSPLPSRKTLTTLIETACVQENLPAPKNILLHYLGGKIEIELYITLPSENYQKVINILNKLAYIKAIYVYKFYQYYQSPDHEGAIFHV